MRFADRRESLNAYHFSDLVWRVLSLLGVPLFLPPVLKPFAIYLSRF